MLYRNQGNLLWGPGRFDWGEQIVLVTGGMCMHLSSNSYIKRYTGASGIGELLANTLAVRNVSVIVLDVNPIITENCEYIFLCAPFLNGIMLQTISHTINAMSRNGRKLKQSRRR